MFGNNFFLIFVKLNLSIVVFISLTFFIIFTIPVFIYHFMVSRISRFLKPELGQIISSGSAMFIADAIHSAPKCNVVLGFEIEGIISLEGWIKICNKFLTAKDSDCSENLRFPELQQYITNFMGFKFFKNDPKFSVHNHVKLIPYKQNLELDSFRETLATSPWPKERPLWEFHIFNDTDTGMSWAFYRFHHLLGDGFSFLNIVEEICNKKVLGIQEELPTPNIPKQSSLISFMAFPFKAVWDISDAMIAALKQGKKKSPFYPQNRNNKVFISTGQHLSIKKVKDIKNAFNVSFSSVIFCALSTALGEFVASKYQTKVDMLPFITVLPLPNHSEKLRNEMTGAISYLPIQEQGILESLKLCQNEYEKLKNSTIPIVNNYLQQLFDLYFPSLAGIFAKNYYATCGLSNIPGGFIYNFVQGKKIIHATFSAGQQSGILGLGFGLVSYVDKICVSTFAHESVLSKNEVNVLTKMVVENIEKLYDIVLSQQMLIN